MIFFRAFKERESSSHFLRAASAIWIAHESNRLRCFGSFRFGVGQKKQNKQFWRLLLIISDTKGLRRYVWSNNICDIRFTITRLERAYAEIREMPAADVAEVVHGQWYMLDDCANAGLYCSACSRRVHREEFAYKKLKSKYCPHCGARMDGGCENA